MNRNVTASFGLSVGIVLCFAVILYQPDTPAALPAATASAARQAETPRHDPTPLPPAPLAASKVAAVNPPTSGVESARGSVDNGSGPVARTVSRKIVAREPRGAFTQARADESLAQVARRVYGDEGSAEALWRANRDVLDQADAPLRAGMLLRTP